MTSGDHNAVVPYTEPWHPGPTAPRMVLGSRLRRLREESGVSMEAAADAIRCTHSKISRVELGRHGVKGRDITDLLDLYRVDEAERAIMLELCRQGNTPGWWKRPYGDLVPKHLEAYIDLEQAAELLRGFENRFVPDLLQTPDYARAELRVSHPGEDVHMLERRVDFRLRRQEALTRPGGPQLWMVLDEAAVRRPAGNAPLMRAQFAHLLDLADRPNVTVQVLPFERGVHRSAGSPVSLLRLAGTDLPDVVYLETPNGGDYPDRPEDVGRYLHILNQIGTRAAPPQDTASLLHAILTDR